MLINTNTTNSTTASTTVFWLVFPLSHPHPTTSQPLPASSRYTAIFTSGDYPLVEFTFWGKVVNFFNVLVAVGVVGIPASVLASGFADLLDQKRSGEYDEYDEYDEKPLG